MTRFDAKSAELALETAARQGEVAYVTAVADVCDEAQRLLRIGAERDSLELYGVIANLDIDDRTIESAVDHARRLLEARGITAAPSIEREYQRYLDQLPPQQRYLLLARQCLRELASAPSIDRATELRTQAIEHFEKARANGPLGKKDERVFAGLKRAAQQGDEADEAR